MEHQKAARELNKLVTDSLGRRGTSRRQFYLGNVHGFTNDGEYIVARGGTMGSPIKVLRDPRLMPSEGDSILIFSYGGNPNDTLIVGD